MYISGTNQIIPEMTSEMTSASLTFSNGKLIKHHSNQSQNTRSYYHFKSQRLHQRPLH